MTCAHPRLPFGTWVRVTDLDTGQKVKVRVNDRGPFTHRKRVIDLSHEAARRLGMLQRGLARVRVEPLE
jgi:rare lipoprotein A